MRNLLITLIATLSIVFTSFGQTKVGGITVPKTLKYQTQELNFNGAGVREKFWIDLYVCALFLQDKEVNSTNVVNADKPMAIRLEILSSLVSKKKLIGAFTKGIDETNDSKDIKRNNDKINVFLQLIKGEIEVGEVFDIIYLPSKGVALLRNNKELGVIEGLDFKKIIFNIWLNKTSVDDDLKDELMGK